MPNWCLNRVNVFHRDAQKVADLKAAIAKTEFCVYFLPLNNGKWSIDAACATWGTKLDIGEAVVAPQDHPNYLSFSFQSAWSPPHLVYEHMIQNGWELTAQFFEPAMGFIGKYRDKNSTMISNYYEFDKPIPKELGDVFDLKEYEFDLNNGFYVCNSKNT